MLAGLILSSGCITFAKETAKEMMGTPEPTPEPTSIAVIETTTPEPAPTPEPTPTMSEEQLMEQSNGLRMGKWISFTRLNVSGYKDLTFHTRVWGWTEAPSVEWWSYQWGRYFRDGPGGDNKYLFVYVDSYSDEGSARMWGLACDNYYVDVKGSVHQFTEDLLLPAIRLKMFDEIWDSRHLENLKPYGYIRTQDDLNRDTAIPLGFLKAGYSNMWSGYCVASIPYDTDVRKDVRILGQFGSLMPNHYWDLE